VQKSRISFQLLFITKVFLNRKYIEYRLEITDYLLPIVFPSFDQRPTQRHTRMQVKLTTTLTSFTCLSTILHIEVHI